jgi:hypothetical protein
MASYIDFKGGVREWVIMQFTEDGWTYLNNLKRKHSTDQLNGMRNLRNKVCYEQNLKEGERGESMDDIKEIANKLLDQWDYNSVIHLSRVDLVCLIAHLVGRCNGYKYGERPFIKNSVI